jgi:CheY-like chemotaxis protein
VKKSILIIEDNGQTLYLFTYILKKHGYTVHQARDGREGIELAGRLEPALIILDIQLPILDGYAVARELRRKPALAAVPIIAVTAYAMSGDRERILAAGCTDYIKKPINPDTFMSRIESYLGTPPGQGKKEMTKILIVDDNAADRHMLQVLLTSLGYKVVAAAHGAEALQAARQDRPDIVIADIMMPVMDGFALCRQWKKDVQLQDIPFVFYTATFTDPRDEEFALSLGADRFIVKPTEPDQFIGLLFEVIQERDAGRLVGRQEIEEERVYLKKYNATLIRKLENKLVELEQKVKERTAKLAETVDDLKQENKQRQNIEEQLTAANQQLRQRAAQLRALAGELTMVEQRERKRIAKILHDHLQQQLVSAKMQVSCLNQTDAQNLDQAVTGIENLLSEAIGVSRSLTAELSPPILHEGGLKVGLEWLVRWMADRHGLRVALSIEENIPVPAEDVKILLFEAARELLFNVIRHARVDSARLNLGWRKKERMLQITVSDEGSGFDPSKLKPGRIGAGFGLFSIRERLDLVGGRLVIDSAPGQGSRFTLSAPFVKTTEGVRAAAGKEREELTPALNEAPPQKGDIIRVMLADDHAVMREGLARLLSQEPGIEIVGEARDGQEAVELANKIQPDLILMDIGMPRLNGIDATRAIHAKNPDIRVIGLSMYEEGELSEDMRTAKAVAYVTKSAPKGDLFSAIRACMQNR